MSNQRFTHRAGAVIELCGAGNKGTSTAQFFRSPIEPEIKKCPDSRKPPGSFEYFRNYFAGKKLGRRIQHLALKIFLGFEMRVKPALGHTDAPGEGAYRKPFETDLT